MVRPLTLKIGPGDFSLRRFIASLPFALHAAANERPRIGVPLHQQA
jgi:hypothetical protein